VKLCRVQDVFSQGHLIHWVARNHVDMQEEEVVEEDPHNNSNDFATIFFLSSI